MKWNAPVERVVSMLSDIGYEARTPPMSIGSIPFEFAAMLTTERSLDLIVIIDTLEDPEDRIHQKLDGLSRALDLVSSRRPLTVVLVGPTPRPAAMEALATFARVLPIGTPVGEDAGESLRDSLAVLLPLVLPQATDEPAQSWRDVRQRLLDTHLSDDPTSLLDAATDGSEAVQDALRASLAQPLEEEGQ